MGTAGPLSFSSFLFVSVNRGELLAGNVAVRGTDVTDYSVHMNPFPLTEHLS